jgi:REP-associated tyrosine transposase
MAASKYIHKSHNVSVLLYHVVCTAKYRRVVFSEPVDELVREVCLGIAERYEMNFLAMGTERNHMHLLLQSVPTYSPRKVVQTLKSLTARHVFARAPEGKKQLWGGEFGGKGYCVTTVGQHGNAQVIAAYIRNQGQEQDYKQLHKQPLQLELF